MRLQHQPVEAIGGLRKPRFWAIAILERLGEAELASRVTGDGGGSLVEAWASRDGRGEGGDRVAVAIWNGTLDQTKTGGADDLSRHVALEVTGLYTHPEATRIYPAGTVASHVTGFVDIDGNGFSAKRRVYETELDSPSDIDVYSARTWSVVNRGRTNAVGQPVVVDPRGPW